MSERTQTVGHRRFVRFPVAVPVIGRAAPLGETELRGTVRNISGGGLLAEFPIQIVPGTVVALVLQTRHGPLALTGQIAWADPPGNATRHGIAFSQPKGHDFARTLFLEENRLEAGGMDTFETWLLCRVEQAVEAGEVPEALLTELRAEIEAAKERPREEVHAAAIRHIADLAGVDRGRTAEVLATMEAQPTVTRELMMRRIAEAWLAGQRRAHDRKGS